MKPEIEKKFLLDLDKIPVSLDTLEYRDIHQGYILWNETGDELRVRQMGPGYKLTIKSGSGTERIETEIRLLEDQFHDLWPLTMGRRLVKRRYYLPIENYVVEVDVYGGVLEGLVLAEVEFGSQEDFFRFTPPEWFGREVSEEEAFRNRNLALTGNKPEWGSRDIKTDG